MCLFKCLSRVILVLLNFITLIAGLAVIAAGVVLMLFFDDWFNSNEIPIDADIFNTISIVLISIGAIIFLISFSGCCGALIQSKCLVILYASCLVILVALNVYTTITIFTQTDYYRAVVDDFVDEIFITPNYNYTFHLLEARFKCCGTTGPGSYEGIYEWLPPTCCDKDFETCYSDPTLENCLCQPEDAYQDGCSGILGNFVAQIGEAIGYGSIGVIVVLVLSLTLAVYLIQSISNRNAKKRGRVM